MSNYLLRRFDAGDCLVHTALVETMRRDRPTSGRMTIPGNTSMTGVDSGVFDETLLEMKSRQRQALAVLNVRGVCSQDGIFQALHHSFLARSRVDCPRWLRKRRYSTKQYRRRRRWRWRRRQRRPGWIRGRSNGRVYRPTNTTMVDDRR